ncbi:MAG: hypothetical protein LQ341_007849, partial [Variospora aurantia]
KRERSISPPRLIRNQLNRDHYSSKRIKAGYQTEQPFCDSSLPYPKGTIKRTWALGYERENDIKLEEILQKSQLQLGLFSSFIWDGEWLLKKLDTRRTQVMMVMQAKDKQTRNN